MSENVIFAFVALTAILLFNWILLHGIRKSKRTTRMHQINELYAKYEGVREVPVKPTQKN